MRRPEWGVRNAEGGKAEVEKPRRSEVKKIRGIKIDEGRVMNPRARKLRS